MHVFGAAAALSAAALWATASLIFARLGKRTSALALNTLKCSIALGLAAATLWIVEGAIWPSLPGDSGWLLAASAIIGLTLGDTAYFGALVRLGPRRALLLAALVPPITAVLGFAFLDEPLTLGMLAGMAVTIGGVAWVIRERNQPGHHRSQPNQSDGRRAAIGLTLAIVAAICQAVGSVLTKQADIVAPELTPLEVSVVRLAFGSLGLLVLVVFSGRVRDLCVPFTRAASARALLIATFLGTYLGVWLMNAGLLWTWVGVAATLTATSPIFVLPLAAFVLKERLTARAVFGAVIAVLGIAVLFLGMPGG